MTPPPKPPRIPADIVAKLTGDTDRIAAAPAHSCAARDAASALLSDVIRSIARVPARYRETLTGAANSLAARTSICAEPVKPGKPKHEEKTKPKHRKEHD